MSEEINVPKAAPPPPPETTPAPAPTPEPAAASATSTAPDPIADAPATSEPDPIADAPPTGEPDPIADAPPTGEPDPIADAPEPVAAWSGEGWSGAIDDIPEEHRDVARIVSAYYNEQLQEQRMIARALESVIDETGSDPRLKKALEDIEKHSSEMEAKQAEISKIMEQMTGLQGELASQEQLREQIYKQQEEAALNQFFYQNPELKNPESKEYKRVEEILKDEAEDDLWELWELPDLAKLSKKDYQKVRKLRSEGVPTKYAMQLAQSGEKQKTAESFPVDALSGQDAPGARPSRRKQANGGTFQDTLGAVAESTLLKFRQKV